LTNDQKPVRLLNEYVESNPVTNGIPLLNWMVDEEINNGYPIFGKRINQPPFAIAGPNQQVEVDSLVTLDGTASTDGDGDILSYLWTAPESITLSSTTNVNPTFMAPEVGSDTEFIFSLIVNDGTSYSDPDSVIITVKNKTQICQKLRLRTGWNIFSSPIQPAQTAIDSVFQLLIKNNSLVKIQDEGGNSFEDWGIFGGWTNNIGDIHPAEGYKIKVDLRDSIEICGLPVQYPFEIPLQSGWNIIGYPQTVSTDGMDNIVQQLISRGSLVKVQDEGGNSIEDWGIFGGWTNNIGEFIPGEGYKIKLNFKDTLWIYESYPKSSVLLPELIATNHFKTAFEANGIDHMNINLVGLPVNVLSAGDELAIFDGATCVGAVTLMPHHLSNQTASIVTSATDNQGMPGFVEGNPFVLKLWNAKKYQELILEPEIIKGTSAFIKNETTVASLEKYATTGLDGLFASEQPEIDCYPNPFSDENTIEINLFNETEVHLEVLNHLGQQVKTLINGEQFDRGVHRLKWDGTNAGRRHVTPGIYLIRMKINETIYYRKVVYSK
jgi:hypothetical protein